MSPGFLSPEGLNGAAGSDSAMARTAGGRRPQSSLSGLSIGLPACPPDMAADSPRASHPRSEERDGARALFCDPASEATLHPMVPHASQP